MEFNVKDIRTKILLPSKQVMNSMDQDKLEDSIVGGCVSASPANTVDGKMKMKAYTAPIRFSLVSHLLLALVSSDQLNAEKTYVKVDLFVKGFSIILYTDNEANNFMKTELIALYLDDITFFYTDEVRQS